ATVSLDEELGRVLPVLEVVAGELPVSIDTAKAEVARRAVELGAELVNDVTALRADPQMAETVAEAGTYLCLMHMRGEPRTMQTNPTYEDVVSEVSAFLEERLRFAVAAGVAEERICLDPGIGFGNTVEQNFALHPPLRRCDGPGKAARRRLLAQEIAREGPRRSRRDHRPALGQHRHSRRGLRARRDDPPCPRRSEARRGADRREGGGGMRRRLRCLLQAVRASLGRPSEVTGRRA